MDPTASLGTFDTSETGGADCRHADLQNTTYVFDVARAGDLEWALRGLDPADEQVPPNVVQTSPGLTVNRGDPDDDRRRVAAAAQRARAQADALGYQHEVPGTVGPHTRHWMPVPGQGLGAAVTVEDTTDRSAG
jgi:hypothetical protein